MKNLEAVYIQPTYDCALNCRDCYVKESTQHEQMSADTLFSLIRTLWVTQKFWIRQITLAVDDVPPDPVVRDKMVGALSTALRLRSLYGNRTEFHITINSLRTLEKYVDSGLPLSYIADTVDLMSVSHLTPNDAAVLSDLRTLTRVNYNYMPSAGLKGYREVLPHVDQSYYLLHKAGLGRRNDPLQIHLFKEGLKEIASWSSEEKRKVVVDGCVRDAFKYAQTGFGCNAGISRAHIWPDGHTTGCPYNRDGGSARTTTRSILEGLALAVSSHATGDSEFKRCSIPGEYKAPQRLRVLRHSDG